MLVFYLLAAIVIWLGVLSLRGGFRFAAYVRKEISKPLADFTPYTSVFAPCRGLEEGLRENIAALFIQQYPSYEIIFVSDNSNDPSLALISEVSKNLLPAAGVSTKVIVAGPATDSGQKVHNL